MRFTVERNWIEVIGTIWMPAVTCGQRIELSQYDIGNIGEATRENVDQWLTTHTGDFQSVKDFRAVIGEVEIPWNDEESECVYSDCMFPSEA